jgi:glycosyltransferase 2 family protein
VAVRGFEDGARASIYCSRVAVTLRRIAGRSSARFVILVTGGFVVSGVFAYLAVRNVRFGEVWTALRASNYWWLVPAVAMLVLANLLRAHRWRFLFVRATRPALAPAARAMLIGQLFNNILPARAGEAARVVSLKQSSRTSRAEAAGTVVVERAFDVLCVLVLLFVLLPWLPHVTWLTAASIMAITLAAGLVAVILVFAFYGDRPFRAVLRLLARLPLLGSAGAERNAANLFQGMAALQRPRLAGAAFGLTAASWVVLGLSAWFVMRGFDLGLSPVAGMLAMIATGLGTIIPSSAAAVGVFEAAAITALNAYGVPDSQALSYALVLHALNFFPYLGVGLVLLHSQVLTVRRAPAL